VHERYKDLSHAVIIAKFFASVKGRTAKESQKKKGKTAREPTFVRGRATVLSKGRRSVKKRRSFPVFHPIKIPNSLDFFLKNNIMIVSVLWPFVAC